MSDRSRSQEFFSSPRHSFEDLLLEQLRSTPWLLISLIVHVLLALILGALAVRAPVHLEVRPVQTATLPTERVEEHREEELVDEVEDLTPEAVRADEVRQVDETSLPDPGENEEPEAPASEAREEVSRRPFEAMFAGDVPGLGGGGSSGGPFGKRGIGGGLGGPGGGSAGTEPAVKAGLTWLAAHQSPDGRWDSDGFMANGDRKLGPLCDGRGAATNDVGVSGLALLAFLGAGQTHRDGRFKDTVRRGLKWLKEGQDADGCFGPRGDPHFTYNHAIAALAMAEAYGMTKSGIWRAPAQKGIDFVMRSQNPYGAWRYGERPGDNDVSVTGWMVMALKSARMSGLVASETSLNWAHDFVREVTDEQTGRTGYTRKGELPVRAEGRLEQFPAAESESLTAVGMLIRIFAGEDPRSSDMLKAGVELLSKRLPVWEPRSGRVDMYYWYYGTLAMFQMGGPAWVSWNRKMKSAVLDSQRKDGNFRGSWDPVGPWGEDGGRVYATAVMTMCLEVYYRYGRVFGSR